MNKLSIILTVFLFFINTTTELFSQKIIFEEKPVYDSGLPQIGKIIFLDTITENTRTFDLFSNNPFNKYKFNNIGKNTQENFRFNLSANDVNKLIPENNRSVYNSERRQLPKTDNSFHGTSYYGTYITVASKHIVIYYKFYISNSSNILFGAMGSIIVFDQFGKEIYQEDLPNLNINESVITEDGKYLCYTYGYQDSDGYLLPDGYRIIDLESKKLITERRHPFLGAPFVVNTLIINGYNVYNEQLKCVYEIFDSRQKCFFIKGYFVNEIANLKEITENGFKFFYEDKKSKIDLFEETFNKENIR